jgi:putative hydroxymethylpyrimidine transport system substrate-binding protein
MLAHEEGLDVVAVAALVDEPLTSLISLPAAGIAKPTDLRGKTIATAGIPYQEDYLDAILEDEGLSVDDVDVVNVQTGLMPAILSGRADALMGAFLNVEGVDLRERGKHPTVTPVDELGIPTYDELVLVANSDTLDGDEEAIRLFIGALERGTRDAAADPDAATDAILAAADGLDPKLTAAEVEATLPLLLPDQGRQAYGYMDPGEWRVFAQFFANRRLIQELPDTDDVLSNDLLPGEVP